MSNRPCVDIAKTLRRIVGTITDESVAARLESLAASYEHRADKYSVRSNARRRRTLPVDGDGDTEAEDYLADPSFGDVT